MASYARSALDYAAGTAASGLNSYFYILGAAAGLAEGVLVQYLYLFPGGHWLVEKLGLGYNTKDKIVPAAPASEGDWHSVSSAGGLRGELLRGTPDGVPTPNYLLSFPIDPQEGEAGPPDTATLIGHEALTVEPQSNGGTPSPHDMPAAEELNMWTGAKAEDAASPSAPTSVTSTDTDTAMSDGGGRRSRRNPLRFWKRNKGEGEMLSLPSSPARSS